MPGDIEVVHRHREAALGLAAAPGVRHRVELLAQRRVGIVGRDDAERVAAPSSAATPTAAPCESSGPRARTRPAAAPPRRRSGSRACRAAGSVGRYVSRCAEHREPPAARARDAPELGEQRVELRLVADRIAADERRAADDAVGEERAPRRGEEVALVAPQREEREAVAAVRVDELARERAARRRSARRRARAAAARGRARRSRAGCPSASNSIGEPVVGRRRRAARRRATTARRCDGRERDRRTAAAPRPGRRARRSAAGSARARRAAAARSSPPRSRGPSRDARPPTPSDDDDSELPGAPAPARERTREPDERDAEGERDDQRAAFGTPGGSTPSTTWKRSAHLRRERGRDADCTNERRPPRRARDSGFGLQDARGQGTTSYMPVPRWVATSLSLTAVGLVPWTLWLTFSLPSRHVTEHYDLAWVGFDIALALAFAATALAAYRGLALARAARSGHRDDARLRRLVRRRDLAAAAVSVWRRCSRRSSPSSRSRRSAADRLRRRASRTRRSATPTAQVASGCSSSRRSRCSSCATRSSSSSTSSRVTRFSSSVERPHRAERLLRELRPAAAQPRGQLGEELLERVGDPLATARGHAASCAGAGGASRGAPARPARTALRRARRRAPASTPRRAHCSDCCERDGACIERCALRAPTAGQAAILAGELLPLARTPARAPSRS